MSKKIIIVDIDGTVSNLEHRLCYLMENNWDAFYEACFKDEPIQDVIDLVAKLMREYNIVYCTGRREGVRETTIRWLKDKNIYSDPDSEIYSGFCTRLLMRKDGDKRHDTEVKPELLLENGIIRSDVAFILEDRNSMVKKWRELGFICLQVAEGDF